MMYSATFLASLLACAHGFAATPTGGEPSPPPSPPELECSADEEKFFVYSVDPSMVYPFVASFNASLAPPSETKDLIGNTWQGLQLSITQGNTTITQAGGKPLTVTSPNTLESGGFNVVSEDFCLGYGNWTVRMGAPTHPEMASYNSAPGARWAGSGLPLPFGAETPLPLPLAQQPALGAGGWCGRGVPWVWLARVRAREGLASRAWAWFSGSPLC